jgi:hypothetical protein
MIHGLTAAEIEEVDQALQAFKASGRPLAHMGKAIFL